MSTSDIERSARRWQFASWVIFALAGLLAASGGAYLAWANTDLRQQLSSAHEHLQASQNNAESLYQQLLDEGVYPQAERPSQVAAGPTGEPGPRGPRGDMGMPGQAGGPGPAGTDGAPGVAGVGVDGTDGANGADGTDGAPGAAGPPGVNGADGRGIAAIECLPDGSWQVTFTDTTKTTIAGPCRIPTEE